ncbi:hypothetical protein ACFWNC_25235 [Streptomyces sp. NPDC058369]|uniref:hypothetical protein n=1 Tax=unclassified Streptomyces TaxID=2593676 RepID=UPI002259E75C|nr:hypothetical protein [Streptomyces sp. NBC_01789]MCX4446898.1 hypothetical protein [Streptomyces sp. NBC_01789]
MSCSEQLMTALDALDRAFAPERPFPVGGCTFCYAEQDLAELSGPLHLISEDLIPAVAAEGPDHWDDFPRLYRRLVPRIVRPLVTGRLHTDPELIASRLVQAEWTAWDPPLVDALRDVWVTWWRSVLDTHPGGPVPIRETLGLVTVTTGGMRPWLDIWAATRTPAADAQLADLVDDVMFEGEITDLHLGFYDEYHATPELLGWLRTDVRDRVDDPRLDDPYFLGHLWEEQA